MLKAVKALDRILRGEATRMSALTEGSVAVPVAGLSFVILLLGMFYGLCMGSFAILSNRGGGVWQMISSMVKVPALFFLTLVVTFPSLYVFNALVGSRLTIVSVLRLLVAAMSVMLALLASFGTIVAFFSFTTTSYPFMVLLNVLVFAIAGFLGLTFLLRTLHRLTLVREETPRQVVPPQRTLEPEIVELGPADQSTTSAVPAKDPAGALEGIEGRNVSRDVKRVFQFWIIIFGLVGAQMSWVLRPFIGGGREFALFRPRGSNFFEAVLGLIRQLFGNW